MVNIRPCDVVTGTQIYPQELLVVEVSPQTFQAGTILVRDNMEIVTMPGTYLPEHVGRITILGSWGLERAARALATALFVEGSDLHGKYTSMWLDSLAQTRSTDSSFYV